MSSFVAPAVLPETETSAQQTIGPLWMTAGVCLLFVAYTALGTLHRILVADSGDFLPNSITYLSQILGIWLLLAATLATVYHRRSFLRESLLSDARSWGTEIARGFSIFMIFWVCDAVMLAVLKSASHRIAPFNAVSHLIENTNHRLSLNHDVVFRTAPSSGVDLLFWTLVSLSAGICEELIFRGYLLRQGIAALRRLHFSLNTSATLAIVFTSMLFGAVHLYEGAGSVLTVGLLGATYAFAALRFGNLRAVIVAHSMQDFVFGVIAYINHLSHITR